MTKVLTIMIVIWMVAGMSTNVGAQAAGSPTTPPDDTLEAARVRIWVPVEGRSVCRMTVEIFDDSRRPIRHLVNEQFSRGYYNFYWDKRDDSGRFVSEGTYQYVAAVCGKKRSGYVRAQYLKGERACRVFAGSDPRKPSIEIQLDRSAVLSLSIFDSRDRLIETAFSDSTWAVGNHSYVWIPAESTGYGRYRFVLRIDDFVQSIQLRYTP